MSCGITEGRIRIFNQNDIRVQEVLAIMNTYEIPESCIVRFYSDNDIPFTKPKEAEFAWERLYYFMVENNLTPAMVAERSKLPVGVIEDILSGFYAFDSLSTGLDRKICSAFGLEKRSLATYLTRGEKRDIRIAQMKEDYQRRMKENKLSAAIKTRVLFDGDLF